MAFFPKKNNTFQEKEIRKYEKKARLKGDKYRQTGESLYLQQRDDFRDKARKLRENIMVVEKKVEKQIIVSQKTDDQLLNEAIKATRRERNEAERKKKIQTEKEANLKELRDSVKMFQKKKKEENEMVMNDQEEKQIHFRLGLVEEKREFKKKYLEENPGTTDSQIQKIFVRYYQNQIKFIEWKNRMVGLFMSCGMTEEEALSKIQTIMKDGVGGEEEGDVDEPIEEDNTHWCPHEDCIESTESFATEEDCIEHIHMQHSQINENPRL